MQVKIYNKDLTPITTLLQLDFESLEFVDKLQGDGTLSFVVRADSPKVSSLAMRCYNRVRVFEGTTCVFYGFITEIQYTLSTIEVKAYSIGYLLKNRTLGASFLANGTLPVILNNMLTLTNTAEDTGISVGYIDPALNGVYDKTYDSGNDIFYMIENLTGSDVQMRIDADGKLNVANLLGDDLSATLKIRYDIRQVESSNILNFSVKESGQSILTEVLAKRTGGAVTVTSTLLKSKYGLVQTTKTYPYVTTDPDLTMEATKDLKDVLYSPDISLAPNFPDSFKVSDILGLRLYNGFVDIATSYQVVEKSVSYIGSQKNIKIKLNESQKELVDILLEQKQRIKLLENT